MSDSDEDRDDRSSTVSKTRQRSSTTPAQNFSGAGAGSSSAAAAMQQKNALSKTLPSPSQFPSQPQLLAGKAPVRRTLAQQSSLTGSSASTAPVSPPASMSATAGSFPSSASPFPSQFVSAQISSQHPASTIRRSPMPLNMSSSAASPARPARSAMPTVMESSDKPSSAQQLFAGSDSKSKSTTAAAAASKTVSLLTLAIVLVLALSIGVIAYKKGLLTRSTRSRSASCVWHEDVEQNLLDLNLGALSSQSELTKSKLAAIAEHIDRSSPSRPHCIVSLKGGGDRYDKTVAVGQELGNALFGDRSGSRVLELRGADYASQSSDDADRAISARIASHFASCAEGLVIIRDIDKIPSPRRLLWRFCDDDAAPHKHGVFYFTTANAAGTTAADCSANDDKKSITGIRSYFKPLLRSETEGAFDPAWARIANDVLVLCD